MAGVLSTPRVSASASFYLRKLRTYMYGMYSGQANQHSLAFWDETMVTRSLPHPLPLYTCRRCFESMVTPECRLLFQAKKGCNEVLTCIHRFHVLRNTGSTHLNWSQRTHTHTYNNHNNQHARQVGGQHNGSNS
jgi:hypothetical protein